MSKQQTRLPEINGENENTIVRNNRVGLYYKVQNHTFGSKNRVQHCSCIQFFCLFVNYYDFLSIILIFFINMMNFSLLQ